MLILIMLFLFLYYSNSQICDYANITYFDNNLEWEKPGIGVYCLYLGLEGCVYFLLIILIEVKIYT